MMEQLENDPWIHAIGAVLLVASIAPWIFLIGRWRRNGVLLPYEPRRPVPWGIAGAFLAVAFTALTISAAFAVDESSQQMIAPTARQMALSLLASIVMQLCGPVLLLFFTLMSNAKRSDVGLPPFSASAIARDVSIGVIACLAALMPVRLVQIGLLFILKLPNEITKHPLVEMLTRSEPEIFVLVLATIMAVVVAPIGEEITFRLLLQGWLEKWEDRQLGWRKAVTTETPTAEAIDSHESADTAALLSNEAQQTETPTLLNHTLHTIDAADEAVEMEEMVGSPVPPRQGVGGLPYGWVPIILSSLLFAAAHFGYGPEPVPLFVLALFLGFCYQRTHRILPCIVAHSLFNLFSMIVLWRIVLQGAE